jgi:hypothetical protein
MVAAASVFSMIFIKNRSPSHVFLAIAINIKEKLPIGGASISFCNINYKIPSGTV